MINRIKRKFVIMATVFMVILMVMIVSVMNIVNYSSVVSEADSVLDVISRPDAPFFDNGPGQPGENENDAPGRPGGERNGERFMPDDIAGGDRDMRGKNEKGPMKPPGDRRDMLPRGMSMEVPYESRFFTVTVSNDGEIMQSDLSRIVTVDEERAGEYIKKVTGSGGARGFIENFRYLKTSDDLGTKIFFLDCGRRLDSFRRFLIISIITALCACILVFTAFALTAGRIVQPIAESYEKQKRFISDAGHEIKTPLTIINANVDLLELDGEKEELTDIRSQTTRLTELTNDLIMLSKMEEADENLGKVDFPLSDLVGEMVNTFRAPAAANELEFVTSIPEGILMNGSPDSIRRLLSVLLENAVKYSVKGSRIQVNLTQQKKTVTLSVINATENIMNEKDLAHVFDRFYRTDLSRNSETGGHGIGLSIAKAIVTAHGGNITADTGTGQDFCVTAVFPTLI